MCPSKSNANIYSARCDKSVGKEGKAKAYKAIVSDGMYAKKKQNKSLGAQGK